VDDKLYGGVNRGELGIFAGQSGAGKSVFLQNIQKLPGVATVAPLTVISSTITSNEQSVASNYIIGSSSGLIAMSGLSLREGEFDDSESAVVTIGPQLSVALFGTEESLGKTLTIRGSAFRVGGILAPSTAPLNFNGVDFNNALLMSTKDAHAILPSAQIQQINVQAGSVAQLGSVITEINKALLASHGGQDFRVLTGSDIAEPTSQLFFAIAGVTAAIAGISLLVGGIGIMNIMLVNVAERTREIGIRKALGATHADIVWQFLIESFIMALIGGIVGLGLGLSLAFIISLFLTFDPSITWESLVAALVVSSFIGVLFGMYPALKAAHKRPIESLQQHL
jgi:ABC-type antimicrobial peptide transport system permease subunit